MKINLSIFLICTLLLQSCGKPTTVSGKSRESNSNPTLAAAQLSLARIHIAENFPQKALPYLESSQENQPSEATQSLITETLASTRFQVPVIQLIHPYPVIRQTDSEASCYVAIGGSHPTVIRWDLTDDPKVTAILFPSTAKSISHISLSRDGTFLTVHRDETNLLCNAQTLKPITSLGTFPENFDPANLQPFSENSLLLAHPVIDENFLTWRIRDSATGENLRAENFPLYPKPTHAHFNDTTLVVELEDGTETSIPLIGDVAHHPTTSRLREVPAPANTDFTSESCTITLNQTIPLNPSVPRSRPLLQALTGYRLDETTQNLIEIPTANRLEILSQSFPEIPPTLKLFSATGPIESRLAAAYPAEFPHLTAPDRAQTLIVRETFATKNPAAISALIASLPPSSLATSTALFLSLKSNNPDFIRHILSIAKNVPPALKDPEIQVPTNYRNEQDWLGYESPDFTEIFTLRQSDKSSLLTELQLPANPTEEDVQIFTTQLLSPENQQNLPRETLARSALAAAIALSKNQSHATSALQLATLAQRLGTPQPEVLRTQAIAFSTLADFESAHRTWLDLITNQSEATHLPSDYSEAAHTAFEIADPDQASEILRTGLFRFPNDVALAIRAGWIALLTDQPAQSLEYLDHATTLGLPPDEIENTTALLAIAHTQLGDPESASAYLEQLKAIDEKWNDPASIEKLPWPDPFKIALVQLYPLDLILPE